MKPPMKKLLFTLFISAFSLFSIAQDISLTKDETINYINKLLQKTVGLEYNRGSTVERIALTETPKGLRFSYTASGSNKFAFNAYDEHSWGSYDKCPDRSYDFDPIYVKDIVLKSSGYGNIRYLVLSFIKKELVKEKISGCPEVYYGRNQTVNDVLFFFLMAQQSDFDKFKKAFQHLIALYKAEDDPFG
jgi:hypothetical protein